MKGLLQLRVLGLGFFQDGDVGAGILPALGLLRVRHSLAQKLVAQGRVLELGLGVNGPGVGSNSARSGIGNLCIMMNLPQTVGA